MSRKSTMTPEWDALVNAVRFEAEKVKQSPLDYIRDALDMSQSTFYRAARGMQPWTDQQRGTLEILADLFDAPNPVEATPRRIPTLVPLRMLGEALERGFPPADRTLQKLRAMYPETLLLRLAESEDAPENILRAVTALLETSQ